MGTMTTKSSMEKFNLYGQMLKHAADGVQKVEISPLKSWPAKPHDRQAEMDRFRAYWSQYK